MTKPLCEWSVDALLNYIHDCRVYRDYGEHMYSAVAEYNRRCCPCNQRLNRWGNVEYFDGECWFDERYVCNCCRDEREANGKPYRFADEQYSLGIYAGRYCDTCWEHSGYRKEGAEGFDPTYAGECYDEY